MIFTKTLQMFTRILIHIKKQPQHQNVEEISISKITLNNLLNHSMLKYNFAP